MSQTCLIRLCDTMMLYKHVIMHVLTWHDPGCRQTFPAYKTQLCWDYNANDPASCPRGVTCNFAHGDEELP